MNDERRVFNTLLKITGSSGVSHTPARNSNDGKAPSGTPTAIITDSKTVIQQERPHIRWTELNRAHRRTKPRSTENVFLALIRVQQNCKQSAQFACSMTTEY